MLEGKARVEDTDMPMKMQIQAMTSASQALDLYDVLDCKSIAAHIKKFDLKHGGGWQCVVGSNFGCFFTHSKGSFIYFTLETLNFPHLQRSSFSLIDSVSAFDCQESCRDRKWEEGKVVI
ncbi:DYNEIN LIGHT CHAIN [Salix purpurea]|uniref:Dynein light chain n=1 Tax=Salix purpurea TaxID=77065 RepID=A0A9Q0TH90_SALPP|nr:DYNEIN LIGHT CHAIN [Salix purpurea]